MKKQILQLVSLLVILLIMSCAWRDKAIITIKVRADNLPHRGGVHIVGSKNMLGRWVKDHKPLSQQADSTWSIAIPVQIGDTLEFKITRGHWRSEAVDSAGVELPNFRVAARHDTTISLDVNYWADQFFGPTVISKRRFENKGWTIELAKNWKFHAGDDSTWAASDVDDSDWQPVQTHMRDRRGDRAPREREDQPDSTRRPRPQRPQWDGIGWFRLRVYVDSSIVFFPLSLHMRQNGASEIYLDGEKLYSFGKVSSIADFEKIYHERNPKPVIFTSPGEHVFAVRYSFHDTDRLIDIPLGRGFDMWLGHLENAITARTQLIRSFSFNQLVFAIIPLSFAVMHLLLFIFYPQNKNNLYYALSMFFFAIMAYTQFGYVFTTTTGAFLWLIVLELFSTVFAIAFGMFSVYATIYKKLPRLAFIPFIVLVLVVFAVLLFESIRNYFQIVLYGLLFISIVEMVRMTIKSSTSNKEWSWIISAGFTFTLLIFAYQSLLFLGILPPIGDQMVIWMYSIPVLAISLSIYISLNFSRTHKELKKQLDRVKQLSEEKLAQERRAKEEEIQKRILEADNARKTRELEEARKLQLSMLPKKVPQLPGLQIAVSMNTATEVGGDYYDFYSDRNGLLTIAIGDATGHGMKAGTMVAAIKSLFRAHSQSDYLHEILATWSQIIRQMNFGHLYMAMSVVRVEQNNVTIANAGMPPALWYHAGQKSVEEIVLKSMPLGGASKFRYRERTFAVEPGDTLLLMSDGFIELFNEQNDMYDDRAISTFQKIAHYTPQEIINALNHECQVWRGDRAQHDDITFVVVKFL
ncbi:hypothetical protein EH223_10490 [candidate division KSB1 bacterium]|nr:SpoIIE family protein phosphatase [candidate division KSB1 bacterium]RQW03262.1 MAG: hypothetical protein EH223_10490 [candidate division KSB1 bacterium]